MKFERKIRNRLKLWGCTNKIYLQQRTNHTKALNRRMRRQSLTYPGYVNYIGQRVEIIRDWKDEITGVKIFP